MVAATRRLDVTRPVVDNDGWEHTDITDILAIHDYSHTGEALRNRYAEERGWGNISDEELYRRVASEVYELPAGRLGTDADVGLVVCMLASPRSGYVTGANYRIDGGQCQGVN